MHLFFLFLANFCRNCAHFNIVPYDSRLQRSTCNQFNGRYAEICRDDETKCGKEGKFYKAKDYSPEPQIISCKSCKFYEPSYHRCKAFKKRNEITGMDTMETIELCRRDETKCGKYGKYFTPYKL